MPSLKMIPLIALLALPGALASRAARAEIEYQELEVYTHQMDGEGSKEFENLTSFSDTNAGTADLFRTSVEFEYGLTNNLQLAAYTDFSYNTTDHMSFDMLRVRARYSIGEQNQLPVDLGVYAELAFPRGEDNKMEGEFRLIVSKDVDRFTFALNPTVERALITTNSQADLQWGAGASVAYRVDAHWLPHFDAFGALGETDDQGNSTNQLLLMPAVDYRISRNFVVGARAGFGMTDATERHIGAVHLEYEL